MSKKGVACVDERKLKITIITRAEILLQSGLTINEEKTADICKLNLKSESHCLCGREGLPWLGVIPPDPSALRLHS